jgi:hypothetical protein
MNTTSSKSGNGSLRGRRPRQSIFLFYAALFFAAANAFGKGEGTTAGVILSQPMGARPAGMGEAYTAVEGDISCMYYNPAGLSKMPFSQLSLFQQKGIFSDEFNMAGFGVPLKPFTLAVSYITYNAGDIELINNTGVSSTVNSQKDTLAILSFSRRLNPRSARALSLGLNIKSLSSTLVERFSASAFAFDLGADYELYPGKLTLGLVVQNAGQEMKYLDTGSPLPLKARFGIARKVTFDPDQTAVISLDLIQSADDEAKANAGIEYSLKELFSLRMGYRIGYDLDSLNFGLSFTPQVFHMGDKYGKAFRRTAIDYSFSLVGEMEQSHRLSLTIGF